MALPNVLRDQWFNGQLTSNQQPFVVNTGTVYYGATTSDTNWNQPAPPARERSPLEWLHDEVEEMCALGRAAA